MTQDQDNIRTMFGTTISFLDENNSVWRATTAFLLALCATMWLGTAPADAADIHVSDA